MSKRLSQFLAIPLAAAALAIGFLTVDAQEYSPPALRESPVKSAGVLAPQESKPLPVARGLLKPEVVTTPFLPAPDKKEQKILAALKEEVSVEFLDTPLIDVVQFLSEMTKVPMIVDQMALDDEGIPSDEPMSLTLSGVSLRSTMKMMFDDLGLTWVIEDEVLKITSKTKAEEKQISRVYPVADLINPTDDESVQELVVVLQAAVPDANWEDVDGTGGTIYPVKFTKSIVIRQTRVVHEGIVKLLDSLREAKKLAQFQEKSRDIGGEAAVEEIVLPVAAPLRADDGQLVVELTLDKNGNPQVRLDNRTEPLSSAVKRLEKVKARSVLVRAERSVKHQSLISAIDALQKAGVRRISVAVRDEQSGKGADVGEAAVEAEEAVETGIPVPGAIVP